MRARSRRGGCRYGVGSSQRPRVRWRGRIQLVFQDPFSSLDPRLSVAQALGEVLKVHRLADRAGRPASRRVRGAARDGRPRRPASPAATRTNSRAVRRAGRHRPCARWSRAPAGARRGGLGARRLGTRAGHGPPAASSAIGLAMMFISHDLAMVREISQRHLGHVPRAGRRGRADREELDGPAPPLHPGARGRRADPRPGAERSARPRRASSVFYRRRPSPSCGCPYHPRCPLVEEHLPPRSSRP